MSMLKVGEIMEQKREQKRRNKQKTLQYFQNKQKYDDILNNILGE